MTTYPAPAAAPHEERPSCTEWSWNEAGLLDVVRLHCHQCGLDRPVRSTFTASPRFDPTVAYRLTCGHSVI